jgi:hypothetical protein
MYACTMTLLSTLACNAFQSLRCCLDAAILLAGATKATSTTLSCSGAIDSSPATLNLTQSAFQHNHWAAVPLLIQAGVPWPEGLQPLWKVDGSQQRTNVVTAHGLACLEVGCCIQVDVHAPMSHAAIHICIGSCIRIVVCTCLLGWPSKFARNSLHSSSTHLCSLSTCHVPQPQAQLCFNRHHKKHTPPAISAVMLNNNHDPCAMQPTYKQI